MKFRVEIWRVVKFILITGAVNVLFSFINSGLISVLSASRIPSAGTWLSAASYLYTILTAIIAALLNRYFTFRATEKWYIAVPVMVIAALGWTLLTAAPRAAAAHISMNTMLSMTSILGAAWFAVSYLLQRCVIYSHTTDQNGWYRRFHPTNDEKGE